MDEPPATTTERVARELCRQFYGRGREHGPDLQRLVDARWEAFIEDAQAVLGIALDVDAPASPGMVRRMR